MKKYLQMLRLDHWIKQIFILPGFVCALIMTHLSMRHEILFKLVIAFLTTNMMASANYIINEWIDAEFDKYHPVKNKRVAVCESVQGKVVWLIWFILALCGLIMAKFVNHTFFLAILCLWLMGIVYNVKPMRTKDIPVIDVLTEALNNVLRLMLGWFVVSPCTIPPGSLIVGYWMLGAFLMGVKRYAEYRMIDDSVTAGLYRKSFRFYTLKSLLVSSVFYAMSSVLFIGIFLIKYRIELILFMPFLIGVFCYYFYLSYSEDSAVQRPEKLYHEKKLMLFCLLLIVIFCTLMLVDIPQLNIFTDNNLIKICY